MPTNQEKESCRFLSHKAVRGLWHPHRIDSCAGQQTARPSDRMICPLADREDEQNHYIPGISHCSKFNQGLAGLLRGDVPCRQHSNRLTGDRDSIHPYRRLTWPYLGGREDKVLRGRGAAQQPQPGRSPGSRSPSANRTSGPGASYIRARVITPTDGMARGRQW